MEKNQKDPGGLKDQRDQRTGSNYSNSTSNMNNNRNEKSGEKGSSMDRGKTDVRSEKNQKDSNVHKEPMNQRTGTPTAMNNSLSEKEPKERQGDLFNQKDQKDQRTGNSNTPTGKGMDNTKNQNLEKGTADRGSKPGLDKADSSRDKADTIGRK